MSILIIGMEMPKNCCACVFSLYTPTGKTPFCKRTGKDLTAEVYFNKRSSDCPLVPVPPHGHLIDLKAPFKAQYYDEMTEEWTERMVTVEDALYGCMVDEMPPTIVPAEEGE